jgi:hypothetical protein
MKIYQTILITTLQQFFLSFLILFIISLQPSHAYTPPIGIPDPGAWGGIHPIDNQSPNTTAKCPNWPAASTLSCYYIDNTHAQATDTNNTNGFPNKPRLTIPTTYAAGSYTELHGGPYTNALTLTLKGTVDNPAWFRGTAESMPIISSLISIKESTYAFIEHIDFNGGSGGCVYLAGLVGNHIVIRNSKFRNKAYVSNTAGIGFSPTQNGSIHDIVFYNNEFSELGTWDTELDQDFHGIAPSLWGRTAPTEVYNVWILQNTFYHISGNGVQCIAGQTLNLYPQLHHIYIGQNTGHHNRQAAFWSKMASHVIISQNTAYGGQNSGSQPGTGIGYQYNPDNIWIIFNHIYDCTHGIRQSDSGSILTNHNAYIIGNLIHDIHREDLTMLPTNPYKEGQGISLWQGLQNRYVINNTIYNAHGGINSVQSGPAELSGNLIANISTTDDFHITTLNNTAGLKFNHNFLQGTARVNWHGPVYSGVPAVYAGTNQCPDCADGDPLLVSPGTGNYGVLPNSPAIGLTPKHPAYDTFESLYGLKIAVDYNGVARPETGMWTAGAFELGTLNQIPLPTPSAPSVNLKK